VQNNAATVGFVETVIF